MTDKRRFEIVTRLQACILQFLLLVRFPIVVFQNDSAILVAKLQGAGIATKEAPEVALQRGVSGLVHIH